MDIRVKELIEAFKASEEFDIEDSELDLIINMPWKVLKEEMSKDTFNEVRFKYFGVFRPIKSKREHYESEN